MAESISAIRQVVHHMGDARSHASRSLLWSSVDTFSQTGFALVALALLARLLSIEAIGLGSLTVMLVQLSSMPFELLFHDALIQRHELTPRHYATAFITAVLAAACGAALLMLAAPWIADLYHKAPLTQLLRITALALPIAAASSVISAVLRRNLAFAPLARRTLVGRLAGVGMGVITAWNGGGAWALVVMYLASLTLSTLVLLIDRRNLPTTPWSLPILRELLQFGMPNMLAQLLLLGNGRVFVALAGLQLNDVALGQFSLAFRMVEELRNTLSSAASQLAFPLLAKRAQQPRQFAMVFTEATSFTACVLLPIYAGMAATAPDLISVVLGDKWRDAAVAVQFLALASMIMTLRQYSSIAINAMGRPGLNVMVNGLVFAFSVLILVGGWILSADAAAQAWTLRAVLLLMVSTLTIQGATSLSLATQFSPLTAPLIATVVMYGVVMLLQSTLLNGLNEPLRLSISVVMGSCVYVLALFAVAPQLLRQLTGFARAALHRHTAVPG